MSLNPQSINTAIDFAGIAFKNPITVASGTFGSGKEYADFFDINKLGAVITKGVSPVAWPGNPGARIAETSAGMLNSIGLQNPGVDAFIAHDLAWLRQHATDTNVIVNVCGHEVDEFARVIEKLDSYEIIAGYELNISCPNVDNGGMSFGTDCSMASSVVKRVRPLTDKPLIAKLTPNVTSVADIARSVEAAGADGVSLINTVLGMAIDAHRFKPVLKRKVGGLSGPAIKPIALRMVHEVAQAVSIPVMGLGGVTSGIDAVEFLLAGASVVAVGTANFANPSATLDALDELKVFCAQHDIENVSQLIGALREA